MRSINRVGGNMAHMEVFGIEKLKFIMTELSVCI